MATVTDNKENWEEVLQEKIAGDLGVSKEQLIETLKKRPYPRWVKLYSGGIAIMVVAALFISIPYFRSAIYFERFKKAMDSNEFGKAFTLLMKSVRAAPNAKKPWVHAMILHYGTRDEENVENVEKKLNSLPFTEQEKQEIRTAGKSLRKQIRGRE